MAAPEHHIFVCQNERAAGHPRGCCSERGSAALLNAFKSHIVEQGVRSQVEFDGSTCVDCCAWGPVVVVYPEGHWYGRVKPEDVQEVVEATRTGQTVERLLIPSEAIRKS